MGEGKTEAALAAAEVLAGRFGLDGVFVGMPTQATCDAMFTRVSAWAQQVEAGTPVGLLHGKRRFNPEWRALRERVRFAAIDEQGGAAVDESSTDVLTSTAWRRPAAGGCPRRRVSGSWGPSVAC
jgi:CRISPR-associated endonuclease/helicase Cas3